MSQNVSIDVRFRPPPEDLRRYFTTFYLCTIGVSDGGQVFDSLQPEWANLRIFRGSLPESWIEGGDHLTGASFTMTGPSSRNCNFSLGPTRFWGIGFLPLGWARFIDRPACDHANTVVDGTHHPSFAHFRPLADTLFGDEPDEEAEYARISAFFRKLNRGNLADEARIQAIHAAVIDPQVLTVAELASRVGTSQRTEERLCTRHFGFSPKLLLRRQRFMRSLAQFMLDPSLKWIGAMDASYHDQAQFVRDFHEFMGTTPTDYAAAPHPILEKFMHERARTHGAPVQTLDRPEGAKGRPG